MNQSLQKKIATFNQNGLPQVKDELNRLDSLTQQFLQKFPLESISTLKIEDYVIGRRDNDNFCYWLENRLSEIGNMYGGSSLKWGIYYGQTKSDPIRKYRFTRRFSGADEHEVYANVNRAIVQLLHDGKNRNLLALLVNPLSTMFKGKILATYFPDYYIHIYSHLHLDYFLNQLGIQTKGDAIQKRETLRLFKESAPEMKTWSLLEFTKFLYHAFGHPPKLEKVQEQELEIEGIDDSTLPDIDSVNPKFIEILLKETIPTPKRGRKKTSPSAKRDYMAEYERNKRFGDQGEEIVLKAEKKWLIQNGKPDLAEQVKRVSENSDEYGFDILSKDLDGNDMHIEVKSTPQNSGIRFFISANELEKARTLPNHYIYIVYEVHTEEPRIFRWKSPFVQEDTRISVIPIQYQVSANSSIVQP